jgi:hypothetical protein
MSEYVRTTRECFLSQLQPELLRAIQNYVLEHKMGNLQSENIICCETISIKKRTKNTVSWLTGKSDSRIFTAVLLTSQWLIWANYGDESGVRVNAASLHEIRAEFYTSLLTKDAGLEVVGFVGDANTRIHGYIGMGNDPAAQKFCEEVKQAIIEANPSAQKDIFSKWLSG